MEELKAPSEARKREAPECRGGWDAPPQYGGLGVLPPEILKFNSVNLFIFFHDFMTKIASQSEISIAFSYFT